MSTRGASLMPIVRRQRVQQTAHLVGSPVMWYFHDGRIHLDELCQKDPLSPDGLRVEATADPTKVADFGANSANDFPARPLWCCNGAGAVVGSLGYLRLQIENGARRFGCIEISELRLMLLEKWVAFRVIVQFNEKGVDQWFKCPCG